MGSNILITCTFDLEMRRLPLVQRKRSTHASLAILLEGNRGGQGQAKGVANEDRSLLRQVRHMGVSRVVKGRATDHLKGQRTTHHLDGTHEVVLVGGAPCLLDRHEIDDLTYPIHGEKACDEDIGIR